MAEPQRRRERDLTGEYWAAVERHQLVRPACRSCAKSHFPPQGVCPWCQSADWSYEPSTGRGRVHSHTTVHRPPHPGFTAPYVVADIEMDEGWRLFSWITSCEPAAVDIGMPVTVTFASGHEGETLPVFEPADTT